MWLSVVPGYLQTSMEGNMRDKFGNLLLQLWFWWENLKARITSGEFCWSFSTICPSDYNPCPLELPEAEEQDFKDNTAHGIWWSWLFPPRNCLPFYSSWKRSTATQAQPKVPQLCLLQLQIVLVTVMNVKTTENPLFVNAEHQLQAGHTRKTKLRHRNGLFFMEQRDLSCVYFPALWLSKNEISCPKPSPERCNSWRRRIQRTIQPSHGHLRVIQPPWIIRGPWARAIPQHPVPTQV